MPGAPLSSANAPHPLRSALSNPASRAARGYRKRSVSVPTPPPSDLMCPDVLPIAVSTKPPPVEATHTASTSSSSRKGSALTAVVTRGLRPTPSAPTSKGKVVPNMGIFSNVGARKWTFGTGGMARPASADAMLVSPARASTATSRPPAPEPEKTAEAVATSAAIAADALIEQRNKEIAALQERAEHLRSSFTSSASAAGTTSGLSSSLPNLPPPSSSASMFLPAPGPDPRLPRTLGEALQLVSSLRAKVHDLESRVELTEAENRGLRHRNNNLEEDMRSVDAAQRERIASKRRSRNSRDAENWDGADQAAATAVAANNRARMLEELDKRRAAAAAGFPLNHVNSMAHKRMRTGSFGNPIQNYHGSIHDTGRPKYFQRPLPHELPIPMPKGGIGSAGGGGWSQSSLYARNAPPGGFNFENKNLHRDPYGSSTWTSVGSFR